MLYVISGWMRSGTSMMMQALEAGGMDAYYSASRDSLSMRHADELYRPNPDSLFELSDAEYDAPNFPRSYDGKLIKVVTAHRPAQMRVMPSIKVIFMRRDFEEQRQSYQAFFGQAPPIQRIEYDTLRALEGLRNRKDVELVELYYRNVVENPESAFITVKEFFDFPLDIQKASEVVSPNLLRFKREELTIGVV